MPAVVVSGEFDQVIRDTVYPTLRAIEASLDNECHNDALVGLATLTRSSAARRRSAASGSLRTGRLKLNPSA